MTDIIKQADQDIRTFLLSIKDSYHDHIKPFCQYLDLTGKEISADTLREYVTDMIAAGQSANTVRIRLSAVKKRIRQLFEMSPQSLDAGRRLKLQTELNTIKPPKIAKEKTKIGPDKYITEDEYRTFINHPSLPEDIQLITEFLFTTGCRVSEALNIRLRDMKTNGSVYIRVMGKNRKERTVRVKPELVEKIRQYFAGDVFLFEVNGSRPTRNYISTRILRHGRQILGRDISAHMMRHSFATLMIDKTRKVKAVSEYLGHGSAAITLDMYVHQTLTDDELPG